MPMGQCKSERDGRIKGIAGPPHTFINARIKYIKGRKEKRITRAIIKRNLKTNLSLVTCHRLFSRYVCLKRDGPTKRSIDVVPRLMTRLSVRSVTARKLAGTSYSSFSFTSPIFHVTSKFLRLL